VKIGDYLRGQREQARLTLRDLAERGQYHATYLSKVETGQMRATPALLQFYAAQPELAVDLDQAFRLAGLVPPDVVEIVGRHPGWWPQLRAQDAKIKQGGQ
jgi:transcriptional regulator with XRE-family HTH domain